MRLPLLSSQILSFSLRNLEPSKVPFLGFSGCKAEGKERKGPKWSICSSISRQLKAFTCPCAGGPRWSALVFHIPTVHHTGAVPSQTDCSGHSCKPFTWWWTCCILRPPLIEHSGHKDIYLTGSQGYKYVWHGGAHRGERCGLPAVSIWEKERSLKFEVGTSREVFWLGWQLRKPNFQKAEGLNQNTLSPHRRISF